MESSRFSQKSFDNQIILDINLAYAGIINTWLSLPIGDCGKAITRFLNQNYKDILYLNINQARSEQLIQLQKRHRKNNPGPIINSGDYIRGRSLSTFPRLIKNLIHILDMLDRSGNRAITPKLLAKNPGTVQSYILANLDSDIKVLGNRLINSLQIYLEDQFLNTDPNILNYIEKLGQFNLPDLLRKFAKVYMRAKVNHSDSQKRRALRAVYKVLIDSKQLFLPELIITSQNQSFQDTIITEVYKAQTSTDSINFFALNEILKHFIKSIQLSHNSNLRS